VTDIIEAARRSTRDCTQAAADLSAFIEKFTRRPLLVLQGGRR
jgi:hypothetical protein